MANQNDPGNNAPTLPATPPQVVTDNIKLLFDKLTAPESQVVYSVDPRPTISDINGSVDKSGKPVPGSVDSFELRTGPTDLDSRSCRPSLQRRNTTRQIDVQCFPAEKPKRFFS